MNFIRKIKAFVESEYSKLLETSARSVAFTGPSQLKRYWNSLIGYFTSYIVHEYTKRAHDVLIVGDGGGRDYWYLKWHGKQVTAIDIAEQENIPKRDFIMHDLSQPLTFSNERFDAVVAMDVLEHLLDDAFALREFNRVLKPNGVLVVSVPFLHDEVEPHVRIHTFRTLERLLNGTGFFITNCQMRGGLLVLERFRVYFALKTIINYLFFRLTGKTFYHRINAYLSKLQCLIGESNNTIIRLARPPLFGCYVCCNKGTETKFSDKSKEWFKNMGVKLNNIPKNTDE